MCIQSVVSRGWKWYHRFTLAWSTFIRSSTNKIAYLCSPLSASSQLQDCTLPQKNLISLLLMAADASRKEATTEATQDKCALGWKRWNLFLSSIGIRNNPFLHDFQQHQKTRLLGAFGHAIRAGLYSAKTNKVLASGTVRSSMDHVAQTFRDNDEPNPKLDRSGNTSSLLLRQLKGYTNLDGNEVQQKAIPPLLIRKLAENQSTDKNLAAGQLGVVAFFFAMRSCEYLTTPTPKHKKRTKILCINNIRFFTKGKLIHHQSMNLHRADTVTITFEMQKSDERNESVTMHRTGDKIMCPVIMSANIVQRILTYPKTTSDSQINLFTIGNKSKNWRARKWWRSYVPQEDWLRKRI